MSRKKARDREQRRAGSQNPPRPPHNDHADRPPHLNLIPPDGLIEYTRSSASTNLAHDMRGVLDHAALSFLPSSGPAELIEYRTGVVFRIQPPLLAGSHDEDARRSALSSFVDRHVQSLISAGETVDSEKVTLIKQTLVEIIEFARSDCTIVVCGELC
jgi:hypothetical protein